MAEVVVEGREGGGEATVPPEDPALEQEELQRVSSIPLSLGYNPITHAYESSGRGEALRSYDEGKEVNRYVRSKNIVEKNNSNFNIITGEQKGLVHQQIPQTLKDRVERKYEEKKQREAVKYVPIRDKYDYLDD